LRRVAAVCDDHFAMAPLFAAVMLLIFTGCVAQGVPPTAPAPAAGEARAVASVIPSPPGWRPGDRWVYGWTSGAESGVKTVEVLEIMEINQVSFYLLRVGDAEAFWTRDLRWAGSMQEGRVTSRMTPPQPWFAWPLKAGQTWTHRGRYEERNGTTESNDVFSVVAAEAVEVPAGRFDAFKIVRETERRDSDQYWYAPDVRFYVKWIGRRGDTAFEEQLREYHPAPRLIPGQPSTGSPSTR
jgi:hypothetical protein